LLRAGIHTSVLFMTTDKVSISPSMHGLIHNVNTVIIVSYCFVALLRAYPCNWRRQLAAS